MLNLIQHLLLVIARYNKIASFHSQRRKTRSYRYCDGGTTEAIS